MSNYPLVLNGLFPVFALLILGKALKHYEITNAVFLKTSDRLVYYIFFPALLFWKIGGAETRNGIDWPFCWAALAAIAVMFVLSTLYIWWRVDHFEAGSFSQSCYRFNTYIGMAIVINALGAEGIRHFGILIGFAIPLINVMAVSTLIWHSGQDYSPRDRAVLTAKALVSNPLILGCLAGIIYSRWGFPLPTFIDHTFRLATSVTLPLALISIGAALTGTTLKGYFRLSVAAAVFKVIIFPLIGFSFLRLFEVEGLPFKVGMIFFALPTSTALYVLSSQLHSNTDLASAAIVLSHVLSFISLSVVLLL